jgi:hypothetical protein
MNEKSFACASLSVAIVVGVFFYPPAPAGRPAGPAARPRHDGAAVGPMQQARAGLRETRGSDGENGVD